MKRTMKRLVGHSWWSFGILWCIYLIILLDSIIIFMDGLRTNQVATKGNFIRKLNCPGGS